MARNNTIVTLVVLGALVYAFIMIPKLSNEQTRVKEYQYYSKFLDKFEELGGVGGEGREVHLGEA